MRINNATNFNGDVYLTDKFANSGITVQDTSNALVFNAHSNSSSIKYFWSETAYNVNSGTQHINSTSFTIDNSGFYYAIQQINYNEDTQYFNSIGFNDDGLNIHVRYTALGSDDDIHYRFGYNGFNLLGSSVTYVCDYFQEPNECLTINTPITIFNVGEVTFNTSDFVIVGMDNSFDEDYEKVKFDFSDTINLISNNLITWYNEWHEQQSDVESTELQISNSQVNINIQNITLTTQTYQQEGYSYEHQVPTINTRRYEFKYNGLYYNGHAPNTAGGFAMLDSNNRIPGIVTASKVKFDMNSNSYLLTLTLKDNNSNSLSSDTVDLPLESMVVNGRYDSNSKSVVLTLKNGNEVSFSVADLVNGLQHTLTAGNGIVINDNNISVDLSDYSTSYDISLSADADISLSANNICDINGNNSIHLSSGNGIRLYTNAQDIVLISDLDDISLKANDIKYNSNSLNTAGGLVKLDSNSRIPDNSYQHIEKIVKTLASYTSNSVVTINDLTSGLIVAVINNEGKQVYPDIQYVNGCATIVADFEDGIVDTTWTIFKVNYLTF